MDYKEEYKKWIESDIVDDSIKDELRALKDNEEELKMRFLGMLSFGTAGLRGIIGAGLNMMNIYTVRYTTQALSDLISNLGKDAKRKGVCIAYDSRNFSYEFAKESALVLAANDIKVYLFDELRPTPELSFAIRDKGAIAGINITASHNPKEYNGYKVYWDDGCQLPPDHAKQISDRLNEIDIFDDVKTISEEDANKKGLIEMMGIEVDEAYMTKVLEQAISTDIVKKQADTFKIIYTPFHGSGYRLVPEVLKRLGMKHIITVPEQMVLDGNFPTVKSPNPENKEGFTTAIEMAKKDNIDLIIGTDPDADRAGIIVRNNNDEYVTLSGNQVGVLLLDYIIKAEKEKRILKDNPAVIKSIVTTNLTQAICDKHNIKLFNVLTGFKFIGEKIKEFEETGEYSFLFGYEESYGYLKGTYARDKDAVVASMLITEMACWYKDKGISLYEAIEKLYEEYGYYEETVTSITMSGLDGIEKMKTTGENLRKNPPSQIGGTKVIKVRDYLKDEVIDLATGEKEKTGLPSSDVLFYELIDGSCVVYRPSGTEPKIKLYILVKAENKSEGENKTKHYLDSITSLVK